MSANRGEFAYYSDTLELTKKETKEILKTKNIYSRYIKRILDVLLSTIGLVVLSPVFLLIAILIKLEVKDQFSLNISVLARMEKKYTYINLELWLKMRRI